MTGADVTVQTLPDGREVIWRGGLPYEIKPVHVFADDHPLTPCVEWVVKLATTGAYPAPVPHFFPTSMHIEPTAMLNAQGLDELRIRTEIVGVAPRGSWR